MSESDTARAAASFAQLQAGRRSVRDFADAPLNRADLIQVLDLAVGTERQHTPSAHALYPLSLSVVAGAVDGLEPGSYCYRQQLTLRAGGDLRKAVADTTLADAHWVATAPAVVLLSASIESVKGHFADQPPLGRRGERYVWLEAGHLSQNLYLAATSLGLGTTLVAGFDDTALAALHPPVLPPGEDPLAILPLGHPAPVG